jgi:hypothetical protein
LQKIILLRFQSVNFHTSYTIWFSKPISTYRYYKFHYFNFLFFIFYVARGIIALNEQKTVRKTTMLNKQIAAKRVATRGTATSSEQATSK